MKLIDADKLFSRIKTECNPYGKPTINFEDGKRVLDIIENTPTVFDVDKVLEELRFQQHSTGYPECCEGDAGYHDAICRAIKIVKAGGVNEHR